LEIILVEGSPSCLCTGVENFHHDFVSLLQQLLSTKTKP